MHFFLLTKGVILGGSGAQPCCQTEARSFGKAQPLSYSRYSIFNSTDIFIWSGTNLVFSRISRNEFKLFHMIQKGAVSKILF